MVKRKLLEMKKLNATARMIQVARDNPVQTEKVKGLNGYVYTQKSLKYARFMMAAVESGILKVAIFRYKSLTEGDTHPEYEVYCDVDKGECITYEPAADKWRTAKIDNLQQDVPFACTGGNWQTDGDRKLVNEYFNTGINKDIYAAVLDFQAEIRNEERKKKYRSEIEQIDETMREVPDLPARFESWVEKNCLEEYLLYRRGKDQVMYCTHCGKYTDTLPKQIKHNMSAKCPACGTQATYKAWNKQTRLGEGVTVSVLQRLKDDTGWIMRYFCCHMERKRDDGWENKAFNVREYKRERLDNGFSSVEHFEFGEFNYTGIVRWCHEIPKSSFYRWYEPFIGATRMYTPNLKRELRREAFYHMDLKKVMKGGERINIYAAETLARLRMHPFIEYLQKSGFDNLIDEMLLPRFSNSFNWELFNTDKIRINEVLKLDRQTFNRYRKLKGGSRTLEALQYESRTGSRVTDDNIRFIEDARVNVGQAIKLAERTGLTLQRMLNYLEKQMRITGQTWYDLSRHYEDYLDMAETFGEDITDEIVSRQPKMMEYHDRYTEEKNKNVNKYRDNEVDRKYPEIKNNYRTFKEHFAFRTKEYEIVVPRTASDITKEGREQHHCVGAREEYMKRMNECKRFILFLRKTDNPKKVYYTLEVEWDGSIKQFYAAYDRQPDKEKIIAVLKKFTKQVKKRCELADKQTENQVNAGLEILEVGA